MKLSVSVAATALTIVATMNSVVGMRQFLQELPNGSLFVQALGHPGDDSSQETDFAQAFDNAGQSWTKSLCEAKFPGSSMTSGEAFGDPCCTWKKGGKPDFIVTPFTTTPTKATTCASGGAPSSASDATKGGASDATKGSSDGASDATKGSSGGASDAMKGGASDATKGGASDATKGSSDGASDATKGSSGGASDAMKGNTWGATPSPALRCTGKAPGKKYRQ